ncbi:hypothetical protein AB1Y20_021944 [Prymnesium parvum]|uniref:Uncharacterized protein n=1 Tax=Prymnesium parvum TaxID=97485 RepID=A0AB34JFN8_PRYPA
MLTPLLLCAISSASARSALLHSSPARARDALSLLRGGGEPSDELLQATFACNRLHATVLAEATSELAALRKTLRGGEAVQGFGAKADELLSSAAAKFEAEAPKGESDVSSLYKDKAEELHEVLMTSLEPLFSMQLSLLKDAALDQFKAATTGDADPSDAMNSAESMFVREASDSIPSKSDWNFKAERASLVSVMQAIAAPSKKATQIKLDAARQLSTAMQYLQMQQQQMQAMQAQYTGGQGGKWNLGAAYRPPDTNINLSGAYQQGRTNLQISMVPDEGANLLGQNGFTNGVGPANLGLSFNIHL